MAKTYTHNVNGFNAAGEVVFILPVPNIRTAAMWVSTMGHRYAVTTITERAIVAVGAGDEAGDD